MRSTSSVPRLPASCVAALVAGLLSSHGAALAQPQQAGWSHASAPRDAASAPGRAGTESGQPSTYRLALRPSLGLGAGSPGLGGRLGASGEYWLTDTVGLALQIARLDQGELFGVQHTATTVAALGEIRSAPRGSYLFFAVGAGYARGSYEDSPGLFGERVALSAMRYDGYAVTSALGWLAHPGGSWFEIGPVLRLDVVADPQERVAPAYLTSLNLALGHGWLL